MFAMNFSCRYTMLLLTELTRSGAHYKNGCIYETKIKNAQELRECIVDVDEWDSLS